MGQQLDPIRVRESDLQRNWSNEKYWLPAANYDHFLHVSRLGSTGWMEQHILSQRSVLVATYLYEMLVVRGGKDYRTPLGRSWPLSTTTWATRTELDRFRALPYFPLWKCLLKWQNHMQNTSSCLRLNQVVPMNQSVENIHQDSYTRNLTTSKWRENNLIHSIFRLQQLWPQHTRAWCNNNSLLRL